MRYIVVRGTCPTCFLGLFTASMLALHCPRPYSQRPPWLTLRSYWECLQLLPHHKAATRRFSTSEALCNAFRRTHNAAVAHAVPVRRRMSWNVSALLLRHLSKACCPTQRAWMH
jgi:hypothetical protein